jgi:hypothetical protein
MDFDPFTLNYDPLTILEVCGIACISFLMVGIVMIIIASRIGRGQFRPKGFLRLPAGLDWIRFLLMKQYEAFDDPTIRLLFGYAYFCLMTTIVLVTAILVLLACEFSLNRL